MLVEVEDSVHRPKDGGCSIGDGFQALTITLHFVAFDPWHWLARSLRNLEREISAKWSCAVALIGRQREAIVVAYPQRVCMIQSRDTENVFILISWRGVTFKLPPVWVRALPCCLCSANHRNAEAHHLRTQTKHEVQMTLSDQNWKKCLEIRSKNVWIQHSLVSCVSRQSLR